MTRMLAALFIAAILAAPSVAGATCSSGQPDLAVEVRDGQSTSENAVLGRATNLGGAYGGQGNARLVISRNGLVLQSLAIPSASPGFVTQILARVPRDDHPMRISVEVVYDGAVTDDVDCNASNNRTSIRFD